MLIWEEIILISCIISAVLESCMPLPYPSSEDVCRRSNGLFPKEGSLCKAYYRCTYWDAVEESCPDGQHFIPAEEWCDWEYLYPCLEEPIATECLLPNGKFVKKGTQCRSYYSCWNSKPFLKTCPEGQIFKQDFEGCEWVELYKCVEDGEPPVSSTTLKQTTEPSKSTSPDVSSTAQSTTKSTTSIEISTTSNVESTTNPNTKEQSVSVEETTKKVTTTSNMSSSISEVSSKTTTDSSTDKTFSTDLSSSSTRERISDSVSDLTDATSISENDYDTSMITKSSSDLKTTGSVKETTSEIDASSRTIDRKTTEYENTPAFSKSTEVVKISTSFLGTTADINTKSTDENSSQSGNTSLTIITSTGSGREMIISISSNSSEHIGISTPIFRTTTSVPDETPSPITSSNSVSYFTSPTINYQTTEHEKATPDSSTSSDNVKISTPFYQTSSDTSTESPFINTSEISFSTDYEMTELEKTASESSSSSENIKTSRLPEITSSEFPSRSIDDSTSTPETTFTKISSSSHVTFPDSSSTQSQSIITESTEPKSVPISSSTTNRIFKTTPRDENVSNSGEDSSSEEINFFCPSPEGIFPHPTDKHKFVGCVDDIPTVLNCPEDLVYDHKIKACTYKL